MTHEIRLDGKALRLVRLHHPWVYRDHVASGEAPAGALVRVLDPDGRQLGFASWSPRSKIALRFLLFGPGAEAPTSSSLRKAFREAVARRKPLDAVTDAARLVSSEADRFPGLIVDRYSHVVVVQALTPFAEYLLPELVEWILELDGVTTIIARNDAAVRKLEGLPQEVKLLHGEEVPEVIIREGDLRFRVDPMRGQKTGLFLDQRANRMRLSRRVELNDRVLDLFSYVGGFALHAALRAREVLAVDDSGRAVEELRKNAERNQLGNVTALKENAFQLLRRLAEEGEQFDVVVLDPPAFAKNRRELQNALRGYREINVRALRLLKPEGLLVSSSCSYQVDEPTFEGMLRQAGADARRDITVLERGGQDLDHPVLLGLPESRYLKCYFLRVF
ncbi:MAG: class I SAM-dependent rRNA methyltransferase [Planctomycetota bacterium]